MESRTNENGKKQSMEKTKKRENREVGKRMQATEKEYNGIDGRHQAQSWRSEKRANLSNIYVLIHEM